jgi:ribosomal protein L11 methylase PrmA
MSDTRLKASFRDPSGFLFSRDGQLYRQVNRIYQTDYDAFISSGLYQKLVKAGLLIPHTEVDVAPVEAASAYKIIQPERIPFISYPYEWSFSQLKDAALATLSIQKKALKAGMSLKDASAYNIQFHHGHPLLIDTLSFEVYQEGEPWTAYRQFCQHFLAPLALMSTVEIRMSQLLRIYIDGIPLDLASRLLPIGTRFNFGLLTHIHLHAAAQKKYAGQSARGNSAIKMARQSLLGLIESLQATIMKMRWQPAGTSWGDYYDRTNYTEAAFANKKDVIAGWIKRIKPSNVWDLGANTGLFSRLASQSEINTVSMDLDPAAVEQNYLQLKAGKEQHLLPLVIDLTNPSPALGWNHQERESLRSRGPAEMVFALALIHHLAISNNVPLDDLASYFADVGYWLVIEFISKPDSQVKILLNNRKDIFSDYSLDGFETAFSRHFRIIERAQVQESERYLYLMERSTHAGFSSSTIGTDAAQPD